MSVKYKIHVLNCGKGKIIIISAQKNVFRNIRFKVSHVDGWVNGYNWIILNFAWNKASYKYMEWNVPESAMAS